MINSIRSEDRLLQSWLGNSKGAEPGDPMIKVRGFGYVGELCIDVTCRAPTMPEYLVQMRFQQLATCEGEEDDEKVRWLVRPRVYKGPLQDYWGDKVSRLSPLHIASTRRVKDGKPVPRPIFPAGVPLDAWDEYTQRANTSIPQLVWTRLFGELSEFMTAFDELAYLERALHSICHVIDGREHDVGELPRNLEVEGLTALLRDGGEWLAPIRIAISEFMHHLPDTE